MSTASKPMFRVRSSRIHGRGVFATRRIRKGTRITEYLGERVTHQEADRRYEQKEAHDNHTFLFIVDRGVVIDAGVDGNDARFINHGCDPNCESVTQDRRVFVEAIRTIQPGEELKYDYSIGRDKDDPPDVDEIFACRCGSERCRGTMLWPAKRPQPRKPGLKGHAKGKAKGKAKSKAKGKAKGKARGKVKRKLAGKGTGAGTRRGGRRAKRS